MYIKMQRNIILSILTILCFQTSLFGNEREEDSRMRVAMRMIGHQALLKFGDSTSSVLPIKKNDQQYRIDFTAEFAFKPGELIKTIDKVVEEANINKEYIVEVKNCWTNEVVHSYQIGGEKSKDILPCGARFMEKNCYFIVFTMLTDDYFLIDQSTLENGTNPEKKSSKNYRMALVLIPFVMFIGWSVYSKKKKVGKLIEKTAIKLGRYTFDKNNMMLTLEKEQFELTSKEAELLGLLHSFANETLKREDILNKVWGDEGDYVGRTLDVFISKLRKKLEADPSLKIANIRGVGYRLIMEEF